MTKDVQAVGLTGEYRLHGHVSVDEPREIDQLAVDAGADGVAGEHVADRRTSLHLLWVAFGERDLRHGQG